MPIVGSVMGILAVVASKVVLGLDVSFLNSEEFTSFKGCLAHASSQDQEHRCRLAFETEVRDAAR